MISTWFEKNGYAIQLTKDDDESLEEFAMRGQFVVSQKPNNQKEYEKYIIFSEMFIRYHFNNNRYTDEVNKKLEQMINNM